MKVAEFLCNWPSAGFLRDLEPLLPGEGSVAADFVGSCLLSVTLSRGFWEERCGAGGLELSKIAALVCLGRSVLLLCCAVLPPAPSCTWLEDSIALGSLLALSVSSALACEEAPEDTQDVVNFSHAILSTE